VNVSTPSLPFYDATAMPIAGPIRQFGGYAVGNGPAPDSFAGPDSGPRYVVGLTSLFDGAFSFVGCGAEGIDSNDVGGLAVQAGVVATGCGRNGIMLTTGQNPSGGTMVKDIIG